jgi:hypothetical protein
MGVSKWPVSEHQSSGEEQRSFPDPLLSLTNDRIEAAELQGPGADPEVTIQLVRRGWAKIEHRWTQADLQVVVVVLTKL